MREQFPWFLDPTEEELQRLWEEATFCFDANVLLNLYRVDRETTQDYFKIFRAFGNRIFLPHEATNQFFLNRRGVIRTEQSSFSKAKEEIEKWVERREGFNDIKQQLRGGDIGQIIEDEIESVFEGREGYEEEIGSVKDDLIARIEDLEERFTPTGTTRANAEEDEILEGLMDIFEGKTGEPLEGDIEDLKVKARERYESRQPPGYEDYDEDDELSRGECEDFLIWKQLMDFGKKEGEDVVFITGEKKPDWWGLDEEHKPLRPRHELLREFKRKTEQTFWMLTTERMLDSAYERLGVEVRDKSVEQTGKVGGEEESASESEVSRVIEMLNMSEIIYTEAKKIIEIVNRIADKETEAVVPKIHQIENRVSAKIAEAVAVSDELEGPDTQHEVADRFTRLSAAAQSGNDELAMSCASDLEDYLATVAENLREEANEIAHSLTSSVSY